MSWPGEIKDLCDDLLGIDGVNRFYFDINSRLHIVRITTEVADASYATQRAVFDVYAQVEQQFPDVSFDFRTTRQHGH